MANTWEQRPEESAKAFHAFAHYRDLAAHARSIDVAFAEHRSSCLKPDRDRTASIPSQWKVWSSKHEWVRRANEYDRQRDELLRTGRERDLVEAQDRWLRRARRMQELGYEALQNRDLSNEPLRELRLMVTEATRMERDAYGLEGGRNAEEVALGIRAWLDATRPSSEEVAELFADDLATRQE